MPPGVVVVKRSRRRPFAVLWATPAWLRALLAGRPDPSTAPLPPGPASGAAARRPRLRVDAGGEHCCTGCGACAPVCPARCLDVDGAADARPLHLRLDEGACIGCGRCIEVCPEGALESVPAAVIRVPAAAGGLDPVDLLAESTPRGGRVA
jgi:ferredoxin